MVKEKRKYKVGDKIVEFGQVFRIFKIETKKNKEGELSRILHFRPFYKVSETNGMTCCIPEESVGQTTIRPPHPKTHIKEVLEKLSFKPKAKFEISVDSVKSVLALNDPHETAEVVKVLWLESINENVSFTKSKKDMFSLATSRLVEEVALVMDTSLEKTHSKIHAALKKLK